MTTTNHYPAVEDQVASFAIAMALARRSMVTIESWDSSMAVALRDLLADIIKDGPLGGVTLLVDEFPTYTNRLDTTVLDVTADTIVTSDGDVDVDAVLALAMP